MTRVTKTTLKGLRLKTGDLMLKKGAAVQRQGTSQEKAKFELLLRNTAKVYGIEVVAEYKFLENRKFRFDFAIPEMKIGLEYEGLFSKKSRHTTLTGYTGDCNKYNLAAINGWKVLRYTAINHQNIITDIEKLIK